jgi:serine/threonine protein kinase
MSRFETVPSGAAHADFFENGRVVSEIEVSRGFLNLAEGLQYLHVVQRKLHLGINPESVVITAEGIWKLCSLGLSLGFQQGDQLRLPSPYFLKAEPAAHASSIRLEPDLR